VSIGTYASLRHLHSDYRNSKYGWLYDSMAEWFWVFFAWPLMATSLLWGMDKRRRSDFLLEGGGEVIMKRYVISELPVHQSATAKVFYAKDLKKKNEHVALKFMKNLEQFELEINMRFGEGRDLPKDAMISVLGWHQPQDESITVGDRSKEKEATDGEYGVDSAYPYILVMQRGDRSLHDAWSKERFAGYNVLEVISAVQDTALCVKKLHERELIHGDIKARNILRLNKSESWILCDLDASAKIGDPIGSKTSTAYSPPELARSKFVTDDKGNLNHNATIVNADPSFDVWSIGVVLFEMCTGHMLFAQAEAPADAGVHAGWVAEVAKEARHLIRMCLKGNPDDRPSIQQLLEHGLFTTLEAWPIS
jgi:serine/threonine protein kinase